MKLKRLADLQGRKTGSSWQLLSVSGNSGRSSRKIKSTRKRSGCLRKYLIGRKS